MRILKFLADLPWWTGLPVFLTGTAIVAHWYPVGLIVSLFGAWTFYKLMEPGDFKEPGFALVGFPLFFAAMLIPAKFHTQMPLLGFLNDLSTTVTYATRSALGLVTGFMSFRSFR
jgi:hypothetical protein